MAGEPSPLLHDPDSLDVLCRRGPYLPDPAAPGFYNSPALYQRARLSARLTPTRLSILPGIFRSQRGEGGGVGLSGRSPGDCVARSFPLMDVDPPTSLAPGENQHRLTKLDFVSLLQGICLVFRNQLSIDFSAVSTTFVLQAIVPISHVYNGSVET